MKAIMVAFFVTMACVVLVIPPTPLPSPDLSSNVFHAAGWADGHACAAEKLFTGKNISACAQPYNHLYGLFPYYAWAWEAGVSYAMWEHTHCVVSEDTDWARVCAEE